MFAKKRGPRIVLRSKFFWGRKTNEATFNGLRTEPLSLAKYILTLVVTSLAIGKHNYVKGTFTLIVSLLVGYYVH